MFGLIELGWFILVLENDCKFDFGLIYCYVVMVNVYGFLWSLFKKCFSFFWYFFDCGLLWFVFGIGINNLELGVVLNNCCFNLIGISWFLVLCDCNKGLWYLWIFLSELKCCCINKLVGMVGSRFFVIVGMEVKVFVSINFFVLLLVVRLIVIVLLSDWFIKIIFCLGIFVWVVSYVWVVCVLVKIFVLFGVFLLLL